MKCKHARVCPNCINNYKKPDSKYCGSCKNILKGETSNFFCKKCKVARKLLKEWENVN